MSSYAHAEGYLTTANGAEAHAEGYKTSAFGSHSHAEGWDTIASSSNSHAEGHGTIANHKDTHASGAYNCYYSQGIIQWGNSFGGTYSVGAIVNDGNDDYICI